MDQTLLPPTSLPAASHPARAILAIPPVHPELAATWRNSSSSDAWRFPWAVRGGVTAVCPAGGCIEFVYQATYAGAGEPYRAYFAVQF